MSQAAGYARVRPIVAALLLAWLPAAGATAQPESEGESPPKSPEASVASLEAQRTALAEQMAALVAESSPEADGADRLERLEALDRTLLRHQEELRRGEALRAEADAEALPPDIAARATAGPPYSLDDLDAVLDALAATTARARQAKKAATAADAALEAAREALEKAESARRRAREELGAAPAESAERKALEARLALRELDSRVARAKQALRQAVRPNARRAHDMAERASEALEAELARVRENLSADPSALAERLDALEKRRFDLERELVAARIDLESAERRFHTVQKRLDSEAAPAVPLREEAAARRAELGTAQRGIALRESQLGRLERAAETWLRRQELAAGRAPDAELTGWFEEATERVAEAERQSRLEEARLAELRAELEDARREARDAAGRPEARWIALRAESLADLVSLYEADLENLAETRRLAERLVAALTRERETLGLRERLAEIRERVASVWNYEITASEDRSITVGKIATAALVFVLGWLLARAAARLLGRRILPRMRFDEGASHAFESLAFYFLLVIVFLTALRTVNIPLTAFAVVGGALAIGVGFGSQNVVSNFISGLILLAERPLKVGDLIDVDGTYGIIEHIGLRSTRVRSGDNVHIIVPNAAFLENKVINWTHNDPNVRVSLKVGVIYGSPTREVERLIRLALDEHGRVLEQPEPIILFIDFGDDALIFEARFWIRMRSIMDRLRVESELRYRIDDLFREAGLVIAFPQRDVHLDSARPIEVRMVAADAERED